MQLMHCDVALAFVRPMPVQELDFAFAKLGATGVRYLVAGLRENTVLTALDLSDSVIGVEGSNCLVDFITAYTTIKHLTFR